MCCVLLQAWGTSWNAAFHDRLAASIINTQLPYTFSTSAIGFVLRPEALPATDETTRGPSAIWCSYPGDGGSMRQPKGSHGCGWGAFPPKKLDAMLWQSQTARRYSYTCVVDDPRAPADAEDRSGCMYNEVVLRSDVYAAGLPGVIEAIFVPTHGPVHHRAGDLATASKMRKALIGRYWSDPPLAAPLLTYDVGEARMGGHAPFACVEGCS